MAIPKVIIIGGGFGGLNAAMALKRADVDVLLVDRTNHHLFQPLLYQVASAALSPGDIATPIRSVLKRQKNASVIMADVGSVNIKDKVINTSDGSIYHYDYLILATGTNHAYFGHDDWEEFAPGLKTIVDAIRIRESILTAFEYAEQCDSPEEREKYLRFVIVGAGPTGVEMAGAIAEIATKTLFMNFRKIKPEKSEILLLEGGPQVLPSYDKSLGDKAKIALEKMGVKVFLNTMVTDIYKNGVQADGKFIETANIIWAAGNKASPLLKTLGTPLDAYGRAIVGPDLTIPDHPEVFVIGDSSNAKDKNGQPLPALAPVAIQAGKYAANIISKNIPKDKRKPFKYFDKGSMATIGKAKAVAQIGKLKLSGLPAWLAWCFIHIVYLVTFANRLLVLLKWSFYYISGSRTVRLITRPVYYQKNKLL